MHITKTLVSLALVASSTFGLPTQPEGRGILDSVGALDDILVFDSPAYPDPGNPGNTLVDLQTFVSLRQIDLGGLSAVFTAILKDLGISVGNSLNILQDRIKLFGAVGLPGKLTTVSVPGCNTSIQSGATSVSDLGMSLKTVSLGTCSGTKELTSTVSLNGLFDGRTFTASVFSSPDSGFGVISDIDDTVKVSNVLDKLLLIKSTLLEEPQAVTGMPELYASLAQSLNDPQFVYITGSPFQLYPFLNQFLDTSFSAAKGPIFTKNLTIADPSELVQFLSSSNTESFKLSSIDRLQGIYPNKKWLAIGDSTQKDPEVYGQSFVKHAGFITCIWIRLVDGADNSAERFAAAFDGVPADKFRTYTDSDIAGLANIDVAGGKC